MCVSVEPFLFQELEIAVMLPSAGHLTLATCSDGTASVCRSHCFSDAFGVRI